MSRFQAINIKASTIVKIYNQSIQSTLFDSSQTLRSRSRVDSSEIFKQTRLHRLGLTPSLLVSIATVYIFVCKAASIRFELVQAWYKLVIGLDSICKTALVRSNLL
jgi:hypothetical protein